MNTAVLVEKEDLEAVRARLHARAVAAVAQLAEIAAALRMFDLNEQIEGVRGKLASDTFKVIVIGRFKTGKSTFLNALLANSAAAETSEFAAPLPMDDLPTTATLASIGYSDAPFVTMWTQDGRGEPWSLDKFREQSVIRQDDDDHAAFFDNIREFEVGYPSRFCASGVTLLDSPGVDEESVRTSITRAEVRNCDVAIMVFRTDVLAGQSEMAFAAEVDSLGAKMFYLINRRDGRALDERLKAVAWNKIVPVVMEGESYKPNADFSSRDIYFVDARAALDGKLAGDADTVTRSGLDLFQTRLTDFLIRERYIAHLEKFTVSAEQLSVAMRAQIQERMMALKQDTTLLQERYKRYLVRFDEIEARGRRLPEIIATHRMEAEEALAAGVTDLMTSLRQTLPAALKDVKLASIANPLDLLKSVVFGKKAANEAAGLCAAFVRESMQKWSSAPASKPGAAAIAAPIFVRMTEAISKETASMQRDLGDVRFEMVGWSPSEAEKEQAVDWDRRIILAIAGLLIGDFGNVVSGGAIGIRGLIGGLAGMSLATYGLGTLLAVATGPWLIVAALAASILGSFIAGGFGLEEEIKKIAAAKTLDNLEEGKEEITTAVIDATRRCFAQVETRVMQEVGSLINQDRENVRSIMEGDARSQLEKAAMLNELEADLVRIEGAHAALNEVVAEARALN